MTENRKEDDANNQLDKIQLTWNELVYDKNYRPTLRNSHNVCSDSKQRHMYLFGGRSKGGCNNHLYMLSQDKLEVGWRLIDKPKGDIPSPRKNSAMAYCASYLYLFGGNGHNAKKAELLLNDFYAFNIATETWMSLKTRGDIPSPRDRHSLTVIDNKLFIFGGSASIKSGQQPSSNGGGDQPKEFLNDLYMYNPKTSVWIKLETKNDIRPEARYEHCAAVMGNYLVVSSGKCENGGLFDFWLLDTSQIETVLAENKNHPKKTSLKWQKIEPKSLEQQNEKADSNTTTKNVKAEPRWGQSVVAFHQKLIFFGGWNGKYCFNDVSVIDFGTNPFRVLVCNINGQRPSIRTFHGAGLIGNKMIVIAGRNMSKRLNDTYSLDLSDLAPGGYRRRMSLKATADLQNDLQNKIPKISSTLYSDVKNKKKKINLQSFQLLATLGTGSFGRVRLVKYKGSAAHSENGKDEYFAMKMLRKTRVVEMKQENHIKWEQKILSSIRHPFIVNLEATFQDKFFLYLVLELVSGGEFFTLLKRAGKLQLPHCAFYASQIVLVFQFLHHNRIVYRDLKPENLLIGDDGYLRLTDFGFAKRLDKPYRTWTLCGTPEYIAPEILLNRGHSFSVDWWALGILLFEMFSGNPPFVDDNPMKIYQKILDGKIEWPLDPKKKEHIIPKRAREFITRLLCKNLSQRLGNLENRAVDVMKHPFFEGVNWKKVLEKSIKKVPWKPDIKNKFDEKEMTKHFDDYDENTDTENQELDDDPFENDF